MSHESFAATLALIGLVILVSSLLSGAVERTGLPQVAIFLLLGAMLGPAGLGLVELELHSESLQVITTLGLVLVLFSDAIGVDIGEVRRQPRLALTILGPGTLIPSVVIALAAWLLLDLSVPAAAILGAALASTDPVLLRTLVRHPAVPPPARLALRLESGMNDVILLPIVVLSMLALATGGASSNGELARHVVGLFLLGPLLGVVVGYAAITLLDRVRRAVGVRRDYESLYALGVAFTAFAAAEAVGGSGFLAAFAAGLVIAALDVELCDCFLDYGEASAEMFLLLTFVAFGASLIWTGVTVADGRTLLFAGVALVARTAVLLPVLRRVGIDRHDRRIIAWFGPRGLSSLLLVLLPVFAGVPGAERLFAITCLVVLLSVLLHGGGIALYLRRLARAGELPSAPPPSGRAAVHRPPSTVPTEPETDAPERITIEELRRLQDDGRPVIVADVRTERSYRDDAMRAAGALRLPPDDAVRLARERRLDQHATLVLYCT
jgi:NhaP-type Na+/H+ or K+/H+ antiporter